jgi:RHS repeat-associated protein
MTMPKNDDPIGKAGAPRVPRPSTELGTPPVATGMEGVGRTAPPGARAPSPESDDFLVKAPAVSLPKGGGALRSIGETFQANPATGTASLSLPLALTAARGAPALALSYDSGAGNGPFGLGWDVGLSSIRRKTDKGLPRYRDGRADHSEADTFVLAGAEDLVPMVDTEGVVVGPPDATYRIERYRPRVEGAFARIARYTHKGTGAIHWQTRTRDNVLRIYGQSAGAQVADPDDNGRVFEWLLEEVRDEVGNVTQYTYKAEDRAGAPRTAAERMRTIPGNGCTYRYPKRVRYGNRTPFAASDFAFELVFDYGEHTDDSVTETTAWSVRPDVFSSFRAGFDQRCYRLCRRVLMFHRFPTELGEDAVLVRATELTYAEAPHATKLVSVRQRGYRTDGETTSTLTTPSVTFQYSEARIGNQIELVQGTEDLPESFEVRQWQWVDLDGEGLTGLLCERGGAWFYKRNEGQGKLGPVQVIRERPSRGLGRAQLLDLGGDGKLDLVTMKPPLAGYQERTDQGSWGPFRPFETVPEVDSADPNVRMLDLDGDGHADVLVTEDDVLRWYPSHAKEGFGAPRRVRKGTNEDKGPVLVFSSERESLFLADMTGDGLVDLVRVRHSQVCYWPNRGYGHFGAKVVLANSPRLDHPDRFDPGRVQLVDVDGSGPADLVYIGPDHVRIFFNLSGNALSDTVAVPRMASVSRDAHISVADLRGEGTACLVWSSPLLHHGAHPLRYLRLMADGKPHLLTKMSNGLGRETRLHYAPSTQFYLADRRAGRPWASRLHFPVAVLEKVEVLDHVTGWRFANRYAYHHGAFDGDEQEFRGFGMVEQWDTESFADFEQAAQTGLVTTTSTMRVTTYEIGPGAFSGTSYALELLHALSEHYFVLVDGLVASSPQQASAVGVRVVADPFGTGALSTSSSTHTLGLARGDDGDGDWVGTITVVECLSAEETDGFRLVDIVQVSASAGGASSAQTTTATADAAWSDLGQVALYGGPRGGGSSLASGDETSQTSLFGKLEPSGTDTVTLTRHGGGASLVATDFTVYVVQWGSAHRIERVNVTGNTGALGFDTAAIPGSAVSRAQTWLWASGWTTDNDAGTSFLGLLLALGNGSTESSTESSVAVGCKHAVDRDVLVTVHSHPSLSVQWLSSAEGSAAEAVHAYTVAPPVAAERYQETGPVKSSAGVRLALLTASHEASSGELERVRFGARPKSDTLVEARRTEATGAWASRLQVVDFGALSSTVARTSQQVAHYRPPVRTRTWFHTGLWRQGERLEARYAAEAWAADTQAAVLGPCLLPEGLPPAEQKEAMRALKGRLLRQEVYADDNSDLAPHPYTVSASCYEVRTVQRKGNRRHGSFLVVPLESMSWQYERNPSDPRTSHQLTLAVDDYGEVLLVAAVGYPRRTSDSERPEQDACLVTLTQRQLLHDDGEGDRYHLSLPVWERLWELTGYEATDGAPSTTAALLEAFTEASERAFEATVTPATVEKRRLAEVRTLYWNDALTAPLAMGAVGARALVYERYQLAFPFSWVTGAWGGRATDTLLEEAGYVQLDGTDTDWWRPSGTSTLDADHFYHPTAVTDPFGNETTLVWDSHDLLVQSVTDALGNVVAADQDYQQLGPWQVTDPNGNAQQIAFDALGRVVATAVVGRLGEGDTLSAPTTTVSYELSRWQEEGKPARVTVQSRERHADSGSRWQVAVAYSDGGGHVVLTKQKVWPGEAPLRDSSGELVFDADGELVTDWVSERWIGSGRVQVDNKGNPVKQYEPFFSSTSEYEDEVQLVEWGVSPTLHYDPLGRKIRVDFPDGTFEEARFDAWKQESWDRCDTVLDSDWYTQRQSSSDPLVQRSVNLSVPHANTPSTAHLDGLGRVFLTQDRPDTTTTYETRLTLDVQGRVLVVTDARSNDTQQDVHDALGRSVHSSSLDAADTWLLADIAGQPVRVWKSGDVTTRSTYDGLRRAVGLYVTEGMAAERLHVYTLYGEFLGTTAAQAICALGRPWRQYDGAGRVVQAYDFKGNVLSATRRFLEDVDTQVDWDALTAETTVAGLDTAAASALQSASYETTATYDALNRAVTQTTPDDSVTRNTFNEAGLLQAVDVQLRGSSTWTPFVRSLDYNARGQRTTIVYSKNAASTDGAFATTYTYDPENFRLTRLKTLRESDAARLQDLSYTYDAAGNIVQITDAAQQMLFFDNAVVSPTTKYKYDALYRLVSAEGREHGSLGQPGPADPAQGNLPHNNDGSAARTYLESYLYDEVGNLLEMKHQGGTEASPGAVLWRRFYELDSSSNKLLSTSQPGDTQGSTPYTDTYMHNVRGAMTTMPHLPGITRQFDDQIRAVDLGSSHDAVYHYDVGGNRVRKVVRRGANTEERLYLGSSWELYRKSTSSIQEERETLHLLDNQQRLAIVETLTVEGGSTVGFPIPRFRFQLTNHLESVALEIDEEGSLISYEEFHPYGTASWWATASGTEVSRKRYRYTGKERDEETSLGYHGARYYAAWLGRWERPDPVGMADGPNRWAYCGGNPIGGVDPTGFGTEQTEATTSYVSETPAYGIVDKPAEKVDAGKRSVWEQIKAKPSKFIFDVFRVFLEDALHVHLSEEEEAIVTDASAKYARGAADSAVKIVTDPYSPVNWGLTPVFGADAVLMAANQVVSSQLDAVLGSESYAPGDYFYEGGGSSERAVGLAKGLAGAATLAGALVTRNPWNMFRSGNKRLGRSSADDAAAYQSAKRVRNSSPLPIPMDAEVRIQPKVGYEQISFRWTSEGHKFEARWHTRTPGAPKEQGDTWVVTRRTPGNSTGKQAVEHVMVGEDQWVSMHAWQEAVNANKANTATEVQKNLLQAGHYPAKDYLW